MDRQICPNMRIISISSQNTLCIHCHTPYSADTQFGTFFGANLDVLSKLGVGAVSAFRLEHICDIK